MVAAMRWTANKKAVLVHAVMNGNMTREEVVNDYCISLEELDLWINKLENYGIQGLKTTKTQWYPL